jgi:TPR repeat protein
MFKLCADLGHIESQFIYGLILSQPGKSERDIADAAQYLRKAVDGYAMEAQFDYSACFFDDFGVSVDDINTARYSKATGDQPNAIGMSNYGPDLLDRIGILIDVTGAVRCFEIAS